MKILISRRSKWAIGAACAILFAIGLNQIFPMVWYSPQIEAQLFEPDGKPVAGAIVVLNWNIQGPWNGASLGQMAVAEAVTGLDGKFQIPAWGPRFNYHGGIRIDEPTMRIFKPGFAPLTIKNYEGVPMQGADRVIVFRLQNKSIVLKPFTGSMADYEVTLNVFQENLRETLFWSGSGEECYWKQTPRLLLALQNIKLKMASQGRGQSLLWAYENASQSLTSKCGNAQQFFQEYVNE